MQVGKGAGDDEDHFMSAPAAAAEEKPDAKKGAATSGAATSGAEVRTLDPAGKQLGKWRVGFAAQTMSLGPDGSLYLAGSGRLARFSLEGKELSSAESPQSIAIEKDRDALREAAEATIEAEKESLKQRSEQFQQQHDRVTAQIEKMQERIKESKSDAQTKQLERQVKVQENHLQQLDAQLKQLSPANRTIDKVMEGIVAKIKRINAIAAGDKDLYFTCPQAKGYGYALWRTDLAFEDPKCIVTGLSGCCGQMDVCFADGDIWVAENSRHRVVRYNREGKRQLAFGKTGRDGVGLNFSGCCNPMNLCFDKEGNVLASESNGVVKHFTPKGKYLDLVGTAKVQPGCKNSAVKISPDGSRVYYIDIQKSEILVLDRDEKASESTASLSR
jgi:sugar lactone lactonase YvrE